MKKGLLILLATIVLVSGIFAACSKKNSDDDPGNTSAQGLADTNNEFGFEIQAVTDENGEEVTDENGNVVTTEIAVAYKKDKDGNTYAVILDDNGKEVTDKKGNEVIVKTNVAENNTDANSQSTSAKIYTTGNNTTTQAPKPTGTTKPGVPMTKEPGTTSFSGNETVPKTSATGKAVNFSAEDQAIIKSMLEVPYLYLSNYENSDGVPIDIATHTAVWLAEHEGSSRNIYASSSIVLNLFKYYGQTVVNFKTKCNDYAPNANAPIKYITTDDTFEITNFTSKVQNVTITQIEDLGNNNFYKVTADVSGCNKTKVAAIIQKNRLDPTLGFSVKALNWS